jgi:hypothetical protein
MSRSYGRACSHVESASSPWVVVVSKCLSVWRALTVLRHLFVVFIVMSVQSVWPRKPIDIRKFHRKISPDFCFTSDTNCWNSPMNRSHQTRRAHAKNIFIAKRAYHTFWTFSLFLFFRCVTIWWPYACIYTLTPTLDQNKVGHGLTWSGSITTDAV